MGLFDGHICHLSPQTSEYTKLSCQTHDYYKVALRVTTLSGHLEKSGSDYELGSD